MSTYYSLVTRPAVGPDAFTRISPETALSQAAVLFMLGRQLRGDVATTYQPRHRGARPEDAQAFARTLSKEMVDASFRDIRINELDLKPMPVICVTGRT